MQKNFLRVILSFLKVGTIGFGGGAALIPVIETELVENKKWIPKEKFDEVLTVSTISPASLPVSLCSLWDSRYSLASAFAYALPGPLIYLVLLTGFSFFGELGAMYLTFTSVGLIAFVLFLLFRFIKKNYLRGVEQGYKKQFLVIMAAAFLLTCGNTIRRLADMLFEIDLPVPLFSIDIVFLILILIFIAGFVGASKSKLKFASAFLLAGLFALANGRSGIFSQWVIPLAILLFVLVAVSIIYDAAHTKTKREKKPYQFNYKPLRNLLLFVMVSAVFTVIVFLASGDSNALLFAFKVLTSSLTSFGGGEVYIGISEVFFVQSGFIPEINFSTQILGIANSMPGPVLCAIVTGIGFTYGNLNHGIAFGWLFGLLGLSVSITATALGALTLFMCYDSVKDRARLRMVIRYIMPVICGMLITTAFSLLRQASSVLAGQSVNPFLSIGIVITISLLMYFFHKKYRVNDIVLLLIGGGGTLGVLGIISNLAV